MALSKESRLGEIVALRIKTKTNRTLQEDLTSAVEGAFKKHGITLDSGLRQDIIIAIPEEIGDQLVNVVLPGGTNCS